VRLKGQRNNMQRLPHSLIALLATLNVSSSLSRTIQRQNIRIILNSKLQNFRLAWW